MSTGWSASSSTGATSPRWAGPRARAGRALRHHRRLPGAARPRPARAIAAGRGSASRARGRGRAGGADAPGRRWLTSRRPPSPTGRPTAEGAGPARGGSRRVCEELIVDGPGDRQRGGARARPPGRPGGGPGGARRRAPAGAARVWSTTWSTSPPGVVSTAEDTHGRPTVVALVPDRTPGVPGGAAGHGHRRGC